MIKKILRRMLSMCPAAWYITVNVLRLCCLLLFCAFMLLVDYSNGGSRELYHLALALYEMPQALLIISVLLSVCIEDLQT